MVAASARIIATVSAEASSTALPHSVCSAELCCATIVDNCGVYVYYLKGIVSVYFRRPARTVGFSGTCLSLSGLFSETMEQFRLEIPKPPSHEVFHYTHTGS